MTGPLLEDPKHRILLLMSTQTYRAGAFLEAASKMGLSVAVGSEQTHALAHLNLSGHLTLDFHDLEGATDRIVEFVSRHPVRAIVSTDDDGVVLAAMASDALGLHHNPLLAVHRARNKYQTRQALSAAGLRTPGYQLFSVEDDPAKLAQAVRYPCVVKPLALAASRGVTRANNAEEFVTAFRRLVDILASTEGYDLESMDQASRQILVEDYLPGAEVAVEGLISDGELSVLAIFDKPDPLEGPYFEETIYVTPSRHSEQQRREIVETTQAAISALGLTDGPIHAELRVNEAGAWILEVAPRSIGGYCSRALRFGTGTTLEELILEHALRLPRSPTLPATPASGVMMIPIPAAGELCEVSGVSQAREVPGVDEIQLTIPIGQPVVPLPEGSQYMGFIFARGETPEGVEAALRAAHERLDFVIQPSEQA